MCIRDRLLRVVRNLALHHDGEGHVGGNGLFVERGGTEAELADRGGYRRVHIRVERLDDLDILRLAVLVDIELEDKFRIVGKVCGGGEIDVGGVKDAGLFDSCADGANWG